MLNPGYYSAPSSYLAKFFDKTKSMMPAEIADFLEGDDEVRTSPLLLRVVVLECVRSN